MINKWTVRPHFQFNVWCFDPFLVFSHRPISLWQHGCHRVHRALLREGAHYLLSKHCIDCLLMKPNASHSSSFTLKALNWYLRVGFFKRRRLKKKSASRAKKKKFFPAFIDSGSSSKAPVNEIVSFQSHYILTLLGGGQLDLQSKKRQY